MHTSSWLVVATAAGTVPLDITSSELAGGAGGRVLAGGGVLAGGVLAGGRVLAGGVLAAGGRVLVAAGDRVLAAAGGVLVVVVLSGGVSSSLLDKSLLSEADDCSSSSELLSSSECILRQSYYTIIVCSHSTYHNLGLLLTGPVAGPAAAVSCSNPCLRESDIPSAVLLMEFIYDVSSNLCLGSSSNLCSLLFLRSARSLLRSFSAAIHSAILHTYHTLKAGL